MARNSMSARSTKRLSPEARKAEILSATKRLLDREGIGGFSLQAVAREAGVADTLPRHYFGSSSKLLSEATIDLLKQVEHTLRAPNSGVPLSERLSAYLDVIEKHPWGHSLWVRSAEIHPMLDESVRRSRIRLGEAIFRSKWDSLTVQEQIHARGYVGFVEAIVSDWIARDFKGREDVLRILVHWIENVQPPVFTNGKSQSG